MDKCGEILVKIDETIQDLIDGMGELGCLLAVAIGVVAVGVWLCGLNA
ncbi:hypothetical protein HY630_00275 [Candidatus Uhrbacteria bacterium]|nr:hypothetical protein [Candidatus Uhrbacteria bacterium]